MEREPHERVLICGATSAIAQETAKLFAADGARLFLQGRDGERLAILKGDLLARGASQVDTHVADAEQLISEIDIVAAANRAMGGIDIALLASGVLGDQSACESDAAQAEHVFRVNFLSPMHVLTKLANEFGGRRKGCIAVISSVAGDRGRKSNYVYGSSKAALTCFLGGLRNRLATQGVSVLTIKPGFVSTPMTAHLPKGALFANADAIGMGIYRAIHQNRNVVYLPWFWWPIMSIIRLIPEFIFKRLSI